MTKKPLLPFNKIFIVSRFLGYLGRAMASDNRKVMYNLVSNIGRYKSYLAFFLGVQPTVLACGVLRVERVNILLVFVHMVLYAGWLVLLNMFSANVRSH